MDIQKKLKLEISIILNKTGAYEEFENMLNCKYNLDIDTLIYEYEFEENLINPIIDYYNEKNYKKNKIYLQQS